MYDKGKVVSPVGADDVGSDFGLDLKGAVAKVKQNGVKIAVGAVLAIGAWKAYEHRKSLVRSLKKLTR